MRSGGGECLRRFGSRVTAVAQVGGLGLDVIAHRVVRVVVVHCSVQNKVLSKRSQNKSRHSFPLSKVERIDKCDDLDKWNSSEVVTDALIAVEVHNPLGHLLATRPVELARFTQTWSTFSDHVECA